MTLKQAIRATLDLAMTVLLLCAFAYRIIGDTTHEWIGISVFVFFIAHNILNRKWYKNIFKGKYTLRRIITAVVNIVLVFTMTAVLVTGLLQSRTVLAFLHLPGGISLRLIHTTTAYWGLIVIALHIGLNGEMIINALRNITGANHVRTFILRIFAVLVAVYGVKSFIDRDMGAKLFQGFSFDFWPPINRQLSFSPQTCLLWVFAF
jgi:hypothetical protein